MEIRSILVNLDIDSYSPALLKAAVDLGRRFGATISAVAAAQPSPNFVGLEGGAALPGVYGAEMAEIENRLEGLEAEYTEAVPASLRGNCLTIIDSPDRALVSQARRADLILLGSRLGVQEVRSRNVDVGALLLAAGRPVLVTTPDTTAIKAETVIVGWKDTREARRAVADALPFLKTASDVLVVAVTEGDRFDERAAVNDVVAWLRMHDVKARGDIYEPNGTPAASLERIAREVQSDLIVTGAYGHSRAREWLFGGVTRDLLASPSINRFMSS